MFVPLSVGNRLNGIVLSGGSHADVNHQVRQTSVVGDSELLDDTRYFLTYRGVGYPDRPWVGVDVDSAVFTGDSVLWEERID